MILSSVHCSNQKFIESAFGSSAQTSSPFGSSTTNQSAFGSSAFGSTNQGSAFGSNPFGSSSSSNQQQNSGIKKEVIEIFFAYLELCFEHVVIHCNLSHIQVHFCYHIFKGFGSSAFGSASSGFGQSAFGSGANQPNNSMTPASNPFGTSNQETSQTTETNANPFQSKVTNSSQEQPTSSGPVNPFQVQSNSGTSVFGAASHQIDQKDKANQQDYSGKSKNCPVFYKYLVYSNLFLGVLHFCSSLTPRGLNLSPKYAFSRLQST